MDRVGLCLDYSLEVSHVTPYVSLKVFVRHFKNINKNSSDSSGVCLLLPPPLDYSDSFFVLMVSEIISND